MRLSSPVVSKTCSSQILSYNVRGVGITISGASGANSGVRPLSKPDDSVRKGESPTAGRGFGSRPLGEAEALGGPVRGMHQHAKLARSKSLINALKRQ